MTKKYIFETEHLAVRIFEPDDAKRLYEIHNDDAVKNGYRENIIRILMKHRKALSFSQIVLKKRKCRMC